MSPEILSASALKREHRHSIDGLSLREFAARAALGDLTGPAWLQATARAWCVRKGMFR